MIIIEIKDIYQNIRNKFYNKTGIDVERGSVIDYYMLSISSMMKDAYEEINNNKTPHIYSSLSGDKLDSMGILLGVPRREDESDKNYLYRILNWNISNKASNITAIETALMNMKYSSHVTYTPRVFGCGTSVAYIIPKDMSTETQELAIQEVKDRLKNVISPSTYIEYIIPEEINIKLKLSINTKENIDINNIKTNIENNIIKYINGIAPGEYLEVGTINKIGIEEENVNYFNVNAILINQKEVGSISILQKTESKFLISNSDIIWMEV